MRPIHFFFKLSGMCIGLLLTFIRCAEDEPVGSISPLDSHQGYYEVSMASKDGNVHEEWDQFNITLSLRTDSILGYEASGIPEDSISQLLWPSAGELSIYWSLSDLVRHDGVNITTGFNQRRLDMSFIMFPESMPCDTSFYNCINDVCDTSIVCPLGMLGSWNFLLIKQDSL